MTIRLILKDQGENFLIKLRRNKQYLVGRSSNCNIVVGDNNSSSKHCVIYLTENHITVEDIGSKNGTVLNGKKIYENCTQFFIGDVITIGTSTLKLDISVLNPKEKCQFKRPAIISAKKLNQDITYIKNKKRHSMSTFN